MYRLTLLLALTAAVALLTADSASARGRCGGCCAPCYVAAPCLPPPPPPCVKKPQKLPKPKAVTSAAEGAPAVLVVNLPADAKLTISEQPTVSTLSQRIFETPVLEPGKEYTYTLKAEVVRDGRVESTTHEVTVRAGDEKTVSLRIPVATTASR